MGRRYHRPDCSCKKCNPPVRLPRPPRRRRSESYDPSRANDEVKALYKPDEGVTENFFGGYNPEGDGEWHGHYTADEEGDNPYPEGGRPGGEKR
jgi:hypothetical protein